MSDRFTKVDAAQIEWLLNKMSEHQYAWWLNWIMCGRPIGIGLWEYILPHLRTPHEHVRERFPNATDSGK